MMLPWRRGSVVFLEMTFPIAFSQTAGSKLEGNQQLEYIDCLLYRVTEWLLFKPPVPLLYWALKVVSEKDSCYSGVNACSYLQGGSETLDD